jgi:transcriptional regulator with XRE-family HTH domain
MAERYGTTIREARVRQGLSQNRLSELAGISRRHLAALEKGANISVEVLKAVTRALGLTTIDLGDGLTIHDAPGDLTGARLLPFADEIARQGQQVIELANNLRAFARPGGDSVEQPASDEAADLRDMMLQFAKDVATLTDRKTIRQLQRGVAKLRNRSVSA